MRISLACSLLVLFVANANAQLTMQPPGLNPGDQYRLAFITSTVRDAVSNDIENYNTFVQQTADAAPIVGSWDLEWKAVVSTLTVAARDNTGTNQLLDTGVPIYRVDGQQLWRDNEHLWEQVDFSVVLDGAAINPFNVTEIGTTASGSRFWSGNAPDGRSLANFGDTSSSSLGGSFANVGLISAAADPWFIDGESTARELPMLAISEVITVVPEPASGVVISLGVLTAFIIVVHHRPRNADRGRNGG